jgi:DNA-binding XRE family transcriptional regulator
MKAADYIKLLREKSGLSRTQLGYKIGLKSAVHIYLIEKEIRKPSFNTCFKIIEFAKKYDVHLTLDMLRGDEDQSLIADHD